MTNAQELNPHRVNEQELNPHRVNKQEPSPHSLCRYINCGEPAAIDGRCGPHYNVDVAFERERRERERMTPAQIKRAEAYMKDLDKESLDAMVDLDWWFEVYGDKELPAKFMNRSYYALINRNEEEQGPPDQGLIRLAELTKNESRMLNEALKNLDGMEINSGTHVWRFTGRKHFMREGTHNHFRCVPLGEDGNG